MTAWKNKYININKYSRPGNKITKVKKIIVHYTANNGGTAENHYSYFNNLKGRYASAHIFVDKKEALCIIPLNEIAYHANDIQKRVNGAPYRGVPELLPNANFLSVGVEMCLESNGTIHKDTITRTEDTCVNLCRQFKLDPNKDIVRHFDVTAKNCPAPWVSKLQDFVQFKKRVIGKLSSAGSQVSKPNPSVPNTSSNTYKVTSALSGHLTADDAKNGKNKKTSIKPGTYHIYRTANGMHNISTVKGKPGSWVNPSSNNVNNPAPQANKPTSNITVDGYWGADTTRALQKYLGTYVDGIISGQHNTATTKQISSVTYSKVGSPMVKELQRLLGVKADGLIGVDTIKALQKRLGTPVDGVISRPSPMVKELQRRLNAGAL